MCARKPTDANLNHCTEPKTNIQNNEKTKKKQKWICSEERVSDKKPSSQSGGRKGKKENFCAKTEGFLETSRVYKHLHKTKSAPLGMLRMPNSRTSK